MTREKFYYSLLAAVEGIDYPYHARHDTANLELISRVEYKIRHVLDQAKLDAIHDDQQT